MHGAIAKSRRNSDSPLFLAGTITIGREHIYTPSMRINLRMIMKRLLQMQQNMAGHCLCRCWRMTSECSHQRKSRQMEVLGESMYIRGLGKRGKGMIGH